MRLVFFDDYRLGIVQGDRVADVTAALGDIARITPQDRLLMIISGWGELRPQIERVAAVAPSRRSGGDALFLPGRGTGSALALSSYGGFDRTPQRNESGR